MYITGRIRPIFGPYPEQVNHQIRFVVSDHTTDVIMVSVQLNLYPARGISQEGIADRHYCVLDRIELNNSTPYRRPHCLQTLFLLFKFVAGETKESFHSKTNALLVGILISICDVSWSFDCLHVTLLCNAWKSDTKATCVMKEKPYLMANIPVDWWNI